MAGSGKKEPHPDDFEALGKKSFYRYVQAQHSTDPAEKAEHQKRSDDYHKRSRDAKLRMRQRTGKWES